MKLSKCDFGASQIEYLGHFICKEGVAMDDKKVTAIMKWPPPRTIKDLSGFLGLARYYHRFVKGYGVIA